MARRCGRILTIVFAQTVVRRLTVAWVTAHGMSLTVVSVAGVAAGLSALVIVAVACLVVAGLLNAIRLLGELLDAGDVYGPTTEEDARRLGAGG